MKDIKQILSQLSIEEKSAMLTGKEGMGMRGAQRLGVPDAEMADGPLGVRIEHGEEYNCTSFPCLAAVGSSWSRETAYEMGKAIAQDCIQHDKDIILGPGVNIKRTDLCGRNFEYFSEDPVLTGEMAAAYINGVQELGVGTSLKHFAMNNQEVDRLFVNAEIDERTMREIYLKGFEIAIEKSNPTSVMCAVNKVNAVLCSENKHLLTDILKKEWNYNGFVVSDWGCAKDIAKSISAGLDLMMPSKGDISEDIKKALEEGRVTEEAIDGAVERILRFLMNHKTKQIDYDRHKQHDIATKIAEESIVLLKNDDNILPIKNGKKIVVLGEYANKPVIAGFGSSRVYVQKEYIDSPVECMKKLLPDSEITYIPMYSTDRYFDDTHFSCLSQLGNIEEADVVVMFVGRQQSVETEGTDRISSHIDSYYEFFIKRIYPRNKNIVLVMQTGSTVLPLTWQEMPKGIVQMWFGGEGGGKAVANVLCGEVNPSGKLAETFPLKSRCDIDYPGDGYKVCYDEKWRVGYRYYDMHPRKIWFPFGHGLSYTNFEYSNLKITPMDAGVKIRLDIKNTGDMDGKEVVQVYVSDRVSTVSMPDKELKDFAKVFILAGQTKTVEFILSDKQLSYYNTTLNKWVTEPGVFDILVGASSQDIRLRGKYVYDKECEYTLNYSAEQIMG
ncbi:MAG: glycoside hydrolase family 3 N-terminal domain-containing protein [Clostridiales bacterium]|nr:glycoside hydrolase family 3 N-terminal domain-containing protein [Clostridiales bacterium]